MRITDIDFANFRSIERLKLDKLGRAVVFYGRNGSGKSNIIAAISTCMRIMQTLARNGTPEASANAIGIRDAVRPGDFRVQGDGTISLGVGLQAAEGESLMVIDGNAVSRVAIRVVSELRTNKVPVAWCSKLTGRVGKADAEVNLLALMRGDEKAVPATWTLPKESDNARKRERMAAIANSIHSFLATKLYGGVFRVVSDLRHLDAEDAEARKLADIPAMLASGDLKGAFAAAHQHESPEVRDRFAKLRRLLSGDPLNLPEFDPVRLPSGAVDVQTRLPGGGAVSIDFSGLGVLQLFYIVASIALAPAACVAVEEPEAHLHAPTSGRALRKLLAAMLEESNGLVGQLFIATHSNLFDLDATGYYHVELAGSATRVERRKDLTTIDRDHLWEPGPARHALEDAMRILPPGTVVAHRPDGSPVSAEAMLASLLADDDIAHSFCQDIIGAAVRAVRVKAKTPS